MSNKNVGATKRPCHMLRGAVLAKCYWETIYCGFYRTIFNHCDVIGLQSYRIRWNNKK